MTIKFHLQNRQRFPFGKGLLTCMCRFHRFSNCQYGLEMIFYDNWISSQCVLGILSPKYKWLSRITYLVIRPLLKQDPVFSPSRIHNIQWFLVNCRGVRSRTVNIFTGFMVLVVRTPSCDVLLWESVLVGFISNPFSSWGAEKAKGQ
jgi:hypothetical protein